MLTSRRSGILLHPTSLPGPQPIGTLGQEAYDFIDWLVAAGQSVWQILPLGPTGHGDCPYSCYSAFAGNPLLISLQKLVEVGDLASNKLPPSVTPENKVDFSSAAKQLSLLRLAAEHFATRGFKHVGQIISVPRARPDGMYEGFIERASELKMEMHVLERCSKRPIDEVVNEWLPTLP